MSLEPAPQLPPRRSFDESRRFRVSSVPAEPASESAPEPAAFSHGRPVFRVASASTRVGRERGVFRVVPPCPLAPIALDLNVEVGADSALRSPKDDRKSDTVYCSSAEAETKAGPRLLVDSDSAVRRPHRYCCCCCCGLPCPFHPSKAAT